MTYKVLMGCDFTQLISEASAQTQTGAELITKYRAHLMNHPESCALVNNFVKEAMAVRYDNGVNYILEVLSDYINSNSTSWALATACENINNDQLSRNYLNRNAAKQVENLLEMDESKVNQYIRAGALKNVMFCEAFRSIAKNVFNNQPMIEQTTEYTKVTPVSMVESVGDANCFVVGGKLYKVGDSVMEGDWREVSNTFKTIESLLESNICQIDEYDIIVKYNNKTYTINEADKINVDGKVVMVEQFRDNSRLQLTVTNPRRRNEVAGVLEAIAQVAENYNKIVSLDNVAIYSTPNDKFIVIENGPLLYASLLQSNHNPGWTINEDAVKACEYIKKHTNTQVSENYKLNIEGAIEKASEESREQMLEALENNQILSIKERIEILTEKFKNSPAHLSVLARLASECSQL